jgi:Transglycosylase SLT domain
VCKASGESLFYFARSELSIMSDKKGKAVQEDIDNDFDLAHNLDDGEFDFDAPEPKDDRTPVSKALGGVVEGIHTGLKDTEFLKESVKNVLPEGIGKTWDLGDKLAESASKTFDEAAREAKPAIKEVKKILLKVIPSDSKYVPKFIQDKLEQWQEDIKPEYKGPSQDQIRDGMIASQVGNIFATQMQRDEAVKKEDDQKSYVREAIDVNRHKDILGLLSSISRATSRIDQYGQTVGLEYQKKDLELSYRQLFAIQDLLKVTQDTSIVTMRDLPVLVKNTALPDFVKQTSGEFLKEYNKKKFAETIGKNLFGGGVEIVDKMLGNFSANVKKKVAEVASAAKDALMQGQDIAEQLKEGGVDASSMAGEVAGTSMAQKLARKAVGWTRENIINKSEVMKSLDKKGQYLARNSAHLALDAQRKLKEKDNGSMWGKALSWVGSAFGDANPKTSDIGIKGHKDIKTPQDRTFKTINDIIPMYMAKMLRELHLIRTGKDGKDVDTMTYDHLGEKLIGEKDMTAKIKEKIMDGSSQKQLEEKIDALMKTMGAEKLDAGVQKSIREGLLKKSADRTLGDHKNLAREGNFSGEHAKDAHAFVSAYTSGFEHDTDRRDEFQKAYNPLVDHLANPRAEAAHFADLGYATDMKRLGFVNEDGKFSSHGVLNEYMARIADPKKGAGEEKAEEAVARVREHNKAAAEKAKQAPVYTEKFDILLDGMFKMTQQIATVMKEHATGVKKEVEEKVDRTKQRALDLAETVRDNPANVVGAIKDAVITARTEDRAEAQDKPEKQSLAEKLSAGVNASDEMRAVVTGLTDTVTSEAMRQVNRITDAVVGTINTLNEPSRDAEPPAEVSSGSTATPPEESVQIPPKPIDRVIGAGQEAVRSLQGLLNRDQPAVDPATGQPTSPPEESLGSKALKAAQRAGDKLTESGDALFAGKAKPEDFVGPLPQGKVSKGKGKFQKGLSKAKELQEKVTRESNERLAAAKAAKASAEATGQPPAAEPDGADEKAKRGPEDGKHAQGGVFESLTNKLFGAPKKFAYSKAGILKLGLLGEAGPEAIMPTKGGGIKAVGEDGGEIGHLPLTRDHSGRLSAQLNPEVSAKISKKINRGGPNRAERRYREQNPEFKVYENGQRVYAKAKVAAARAKLNPPMSQEALIQKSAEQVLQAPVTETPAELVGPVQPVQPKRGFFDGLKDSFKEGYVEQRAATLKKFGLDPTMEELQDKPDLRKAMAWASKKLLQPTVATGGNTAAAPEIEAVPVNPQAPQTVESSAVPAASPSLLSPALTPETNTQVTQKVLKKSRSGDMGDMLDNIWQQEPQIAQQAEEPKAPEVIVPKRVLKASRSGDMADMLENIQHTIKEDPLLDRMHNPPRSSDVSVAETEPTAVEAEKVEQPVVQPKRGFFSGLKQSFKKGYDEKKASLVAATQQPAQQGAKQDVITPAKASGAVDSLADKARDGLDKLKNTDTSSVGAALSSWGVEKGTVAAVEGAMVDVREKVLESKDGIAELSKDVAKKAEDYLISKGMPTTMAGLGTYLSDIAGEAKAKAEQIAGQVKDVVAEGSAKLSDSLGGGGSSGGMGGAGIRDILQETLDHIASMDELMQKGAASKWYNPFSWGVGAKVKGAVDGATEAVGNQVKKVAPAARLAKEKALNFGGGVAGLAGRAASGAIKLTGKVIKAPFKAAAWVGGKQLDAIKWAGGKAMDLWNRPKDVYVEGDDKPRLYASKITQGKYFKQKDKKPLTSHKDITCPILDETGNIIISEEELGKLFTKGMMGKAMKLTGGLIRGVLSLVGRGLGLSMKAALLPINMLTGAFSLAKKGVAGLNNALSDGPADVYTPGVEEPVMTKALMTRGLYLSKKTGKPITKPTQIDGAITDMKGDIVLTQEQFKQGVFDKKGKPFRTAVGKALNVVAGVGRGILRVQQAAWGLTKKIAGGLKTGLTGGLKGVGNVLTGGGLTGGGKSLKVITEIRDMLKKKWGGEKVFGDVDGDGTRENSLADLKKKAKEKAEGLKNKLMGGVTAIKDKVKGKGAGVIGGIFSAVAAVAEVLSSFKNVISFGTKMFGGIFKFGGKIFGKLGGLGRIAGLLGRGAGMISGIGSGLGSMFGGGTALAAGAAAEGAVVAGGAAAAAGTAGAVGAGGTALAAGAVAAEGAALAGGAAAAGGAATAGGLAAGAVAAAPVILAALAVAGVAYGGYKLYKYLKGKVVPQDRLRLVQYGFPYDSDENFQKIRAIEKEVLKATSFKDGQAVVADNKLKVENLLDAFDVSKKDGPGITLLLDWYAKRFKPVYLNHLAALMKVSQSDEADPSDVQDLKGKELMDYLNAARFDDGPYSESLPVSLKGIQQTVAGDVRAAYDKIIKECSLDPTKIVDKKAAVVAAVTQATGMDKVEQSAPTDPVKIVKTKDGVAAAAKAAVNSELLFGANEDYKDEATLSAMTDLANLKQDGKIGALAAVKYRCYGLVDLDPLKIKALRDLEAAVGKGVTYSKGEAKWAGSPTMILKDLMGSFGIQGIDSPQAQEWNEWFLQRFLPVYLKYYSLYCAYTGTNAVTDNLGMLKVSQQLDIARQLAGLSIWKVTKSGFPNYSVNTASRSIDENLVFLEDTLKKEKALEESAQRQRTDPAKLAEDDKAKALAAKIGKTANGASATDTNQVDGNTEPKPSSSGGGGSTGGDGSLGAAGLKMAGGQLFDGANGFGAITLESSKVKLNGLNPQFLKQFYGLAEEYNKITGKKIQVNDGFRSYEDQVAMKQKYGAKAAEPGTSIHGYGFALDANSAAMNEAEKLGLLRKYGLTRPLSGEPWHVEPIGLQMEISRFQNSGTSSSSEAMSLIKNGMGKGGGGLGWAIQSSPDKPRRSVESSKAIYGAAVSAQAETKPSVAGGAPAADTAASPASTSGGVASPGPTAPAGKVGGGVSIAGASNGAAQSTMGTGGPGLVEPKPAGGGEAKRTQAPPNGGNTAAAAVGSSPTQKVSAPAAGDTTAVKKTIDEASSLVGLNADLAKSVSAVESDLNPAAKAKGTSATGLYQFVEDTWDWLVSKVGMKYGIQPGTPPTDARANAILGAHYLKSNAEVPKGIKSDVNATDLYMTHFLGPGGAKTFLSGEKSDPNGIAATALPKAARNNESIFYGPGGPRTFTQVRQELSGRISAKEQRFGLKPTAGGAGAGPAKPGKDPATSGDTGGAAPGITPVGKTPGKADVAAQAPVKTPEQKSTVVAAPKPAPTSPLMNTSFDIDVPSGSGGTPVQDTIAPQPKAARGSIAAATAQMPRPSAQVTQPEESYGRQSAASQESMYMGFMGAVPQAPAQAVTNRLAGSSMEITEGVLKESLTVHRQSKDILQGILELMKRQNEQNAKGGMQQAQQTGGSSNEANRQAAQATTTAQDKAPPSPVKPTGNPNNTAGYLMSRVPLDFSRKI